ncbi:MAG: DUF6519 domain-containing protein [Cyanobacteria bacterium P01_F01_bin.13]
MQGEFRGDFTRDTHSPKKQFLRVLMQQGRVQLDADFNTQTAILLDYLQTLAMDLIGPYGGPVENVGFEIQLDPNNPNQVQDLTISPGRYYIEGLMCKNTKENASYEKQPYLSVESDHDYPDLPFLVYLDVWERHVDASQDDTSEYGSIREVALGGPDTATRSQVIWQVKHTQQPLSDERLEEIAEFSDSSDSDEPGQPTSRPEAGDGSSNEDSEDSIFDKAAESLRTYKQALYAALADESPKIVTEESLVHLKARAKQNKDDDNDPCIISPNARYKRHENQLYRIEIHSDGDSPTFKWSRENSAVVFPIVTASGAVITLEHLGNDSRFGLQENDWVEVVDDDYIYRNQPENLLQVQHIDPVTQQVTLSGSPTGTTGSNPQKHPYLRRWDHKAGNPSYGGSAIAPDGALPVEEKDAWQTLEDGIEIQFQPGGVYRPGDYWLIPARTATEDIEWPKDADNPDDPKALPPHGIRHYYAPLAIIAVKDGSLQAIDCRHLFLPLLSR